MLSICRHFASYNNTWVASTCCHLKTYRCNKSSKYITYFPDRDDSSWTYKHKHEQASMSKSLLEYVVHVDKILKNYLLTHRIESLLTWRNILPCVHGWMIFMDEKMDEFYFKCCYIFLFFWKIEKKMGSKQFMLVSFNTNPQMKRRNHNSKPHFIF